MYKMWRDLNPVEKTIRVFYDGHPHLMGGAAMGDEMRRIKMTWNELPASVQKDIEKLYDIQEVGGQIIVNRK